MKCLYWLQHSEKYPYRIQIRLTMCILLLLILLTTGLSVNIIKSNPRIERANVTYQKTNLYFTREVCQEEIRLLYQNESAL